MFSNLFNMDNVFWRAMGKAADIFLLNILCLICCIPIITIGASVTAMYTVTLKMVNDEDSYIFRGFFSAFKSNFKQSTIIWLIMLVLGAFLGMDIYLTQHIDSSMMNILSYVFMAIAFVYLIILSFVFPLQSKFENTLFNTIKNALLMGIAHLLPWTILILILNAIPIVLFVFFTSIFIAIGFPIMILCGFAAIAYFNSKMFNRIFKRYIPSEETEETKDTETNEDAAAEEITIN